MPGNSKSLWDAVKRAKDQNNPSSPENMGLNWNKVPNDDLPRAFADCFENKISQIIFETQISNSFYNGKRK